MSSSDNQAQPPATAGGSDGDLTKVGTLNARGVCLVQIRSHFNWRNQKAMFSKRARLWLGLIVAVSLLSLASSCKPKTEEGGGETPTAGTTPPPSKGDEGTITGKITYTG